MMFAAIPASRLHGAIAWLAARGYYSNEQLAKDRNTADIVREHNGDDCMIQVDFRNFPPLSREDEMLFKLTWCGR
jgi:hypothetical protein